MLPEEQIHAIEDEVMVDPETGEIIEDGGRKLDLPQCGRIVRSIQRKLAELDEYETIELDRIKGAVSARRQPLRDQLASFWQRMEVLLREKDTSRYDMPGIGVARIGHTRETVNTGVYDALDDAARLKIQNNRQGCFRKTTTVKPDNKAIMAALKQGDDMLAEAFGVNEKQEEFKFKPE